MIASPKTAILLAASLFLSSIAYAPAQKRGELEAVSAIRQRYAAVNKNLSKFKAVKKELQGFSAEGGELTAYFEGSAVKKIAAKHQGETGRSFEEYYLLDDGLMFVYRREDRYSKPFSGKVAETRETRLYFEDGELVRWLDEKGRRVPRDHSDFAAQQAKYLSNSKTFLEAARSQERTIEAGAND
jgi:hypothetical protein